MLRKLTALPLVILMGASSPKSDDGYSWHWQRDTPFCSVFQRTAEGKTIYLIRDPGQDETAISFNVWSPKFAKGLYEGGSIKLSSGATFPARIQIFSARDGDYDLRATVEDPAFPHALATSPRLTVSHSDFGAFTVSLKDVAAAVAGIRSCEDGRLRDWGIDVPRYWSLRSRPRPIGALADLFTSDAYPELALGRGIERNVIAKLEVSADGRATSCSAPGNYPYPQFVDSVCHVLEKGARFMPAQDSSGHPVISPYVVLVKFGIAR